jgi:hypothetical protein
VRLKQLETLAVVESAIKKDGLNLGVKTVKNTEKLSEDAAGGALSRAASGLSRP